MCHVSDRVLRPFNLYSIAVSILSPLKRNMKIAALCTRDVEVQMGPGWISHSLIMISFLYNFRACMRLRYFPPIFAKMVDRQTVTGLSLAFGSTTAGSSKNVQLCINLYDQVHSSVCIPTWLGKQQLFPPCLPTAVSGKKEKQKHKLARCLRERTWGLERKFSGDLGGQTDFAFLEHLKICGVL